MKVDYWKSIAENQITVKFRIMPIETITITIKNTQIDLQIETERYGFFRLDWYLEASSATTETSSTVITQQSPIIQNLAPFSCGDIELSRVT